MTELSFLSKLSLLLCKDRVFVCEILSALLHAADQKALMITRIQTDTISP